MDFWCTMSSYSNVKIIVGWNQSIWRKTNKQTEFCTIASRRKNTDFFHGILLVTSSPSCSQLLCKPMTPILLLKKGVSQIICRDHCAKLLLESACIAADLYFTFSFFLELHNTCCPLVSSSHLPYLLLKVTPELCRFLLTPPCSFRFISDTNWKTNPLNPVESLA